MRSRKVSPGFWVISMTMRSLRARVPPVTALRSPPASRMTGADSPVIADSSTLAMPSTIVPSLGITSPASQTTMSPLRRSGAGTGVLVAADPALQLAGDRLGARPAQGLRLRLAAPFGDGLGEVREEHGEPQPERDLSDEAGVTGVADDAGDEPVRGHHRADLDDEHHRVADHGARVELDEALTDRRVSATPGQ